MAFELDQFDEGGGDKGAPKWMTTFGDAITLLVTFFVLLLTYSTPNKRDLQQMSSGLMERGGTPGPMEMEGASPMMTSEAELSSGEKALSQTQFPPLYSELEEKADSSENEGMDVSMLPSVKNAVIVRLSLEKVFQDDGSFSENGQKLMEEIASVLVPFPRVVVVRSRLDEEEADRLSENLLISRKIIGLLQDILPREGFDFRVSSDIALSPKAMEPDQCEILMLQQ